MKLTTSPLQPYRLADHVRACQHDGRVILLDLRRNKYLGIGGAHLAALSQVIADWPAAAAAEQRNPGNLKLDAWVQKLKAQQMLSDANTARPAYIPLAQPIDSLDSANQAELRAVGWRRPFNIACSAAVAASWIRRLSLSDIEGRVRRMRPTQLSGAAPLDITDLRDAVSSYTLMRPFLFTAHDRCLHDSLTLVSFLAKEGMFARWVIGVRTGPFAAHSWVQSGGLVLNDVPEHVRTYTPILTV